MCFVLKIYPLKSQPNAKRFKDIHKHLLTPPFLLVINSTTGTGKTTLCSNIILRKNFYDQIKNNQNEKELIRKTFNALIRPKNIKYGLI